MIPNVCEYIDVDPQKNLLLDLYKKVKTNSEYFK